MSETAKNGGTSNRLWLWLFIVLFPIPFNPWWVTVICLSVFAFLLWGFTRYKGTDLD